MSTKTEPLTDLSRGMAEIALEVLETYVRELRCAAITINARPAAEKVLARAFQETERLAREDERKDFLAALEAADAVMEAAVLRGIQDWLGEGPSMVWASAHQQVRAALEKARGKS